MKPRPEFVDWTDESLINQIMSGVHPETSNEQRDHVHRTLNRSKRHVLESFALWAIEAEKRTQVAYGRIAEKT